MTTATRLFFVLTFVGCFFAYQVLRRFRCAKRGRIRLTTDASKVVWEAWRQAAFSNLLRDPSYQLAANVGLPWSGNLDMSWAPHGTSTTWQTSGI